MLEYASEIGAKCFISIGTEAEYSFCEDVMDVDAKQTSNDLYGEAKTAAYYMLKANTSYQFDELKPLPIQERKYVHMEGRYRIGEWLWMTAK